MTLTPQQYEDLHALVGALCEGAIDAEDFARLQAMLAGDLEAQRFYVRYLDIHAALRRLDAEAETAEEPGASGSCPMVSVSAAQGTTLATGRASWPSAVHVSLVAAALSLLTMAAAIGFGWLGKTDGPAASREHRTAAKKAGGPERTVVARVTGATNCHWLDSAAAVPDMASVPLGTKYALAEGFMEITYRSGARIILQAPCRYEVDSANGGFLSLGKLTAKTESPFVVRTPAATVTNRGAECGVEADASGTSQAHVFAGEIELLPVSIGQTTAQTIFLRKNEAARVETVADRIGAISREVARPGEFMHQMPLPMHLSNTGVGRNVGERDPHWQMVARSDQPGCRPQPTLVASVEGTRLLPNAPAASQWISVAGDLSALPANVTYTFRTTFELGKLGRGPRELRALFLAENGVTSVRLNGVPVKPPNLDAPTTPRERHEFTLRQGFLEGTNVLEIDVCKHDPRYQPLTGRPNTMMLRVEFEGFYMGAGGMPAGHGKEVVL